MRTQNSYNFLRLSLFLTIIYNFCLYPARAQSVTPVSLVPLNKPFASVVPSSVTGKTNAISTGQESVRVSARSLLDEFGHLSHTVTAEQSAVWKVELERSKSTTETEALRAAQLHLWLGEWELDAQEAPADALEHFAAVLRLASASHPLHGRALYDTAITHFRQGAYSNAANELKALVHAPATNRLCGYSRTDCALFLRHAVACVGYHEVRADMGIPEPPALDPDCGLAGLAVCLRKLGLPYDRKTIAGSCRATGLGSTLQDLVEACDKLGDGKWVTGRVVSADDEALKALPLPAVAYVEHDHFIAITNADNTGVTYICSDCGEWPGGPVHLTWAKWHALEPSLYLLVVRKGGADDKLLAQALDDNTRKKLQDASHELPRRPVHSMSDPAHSVRSASNISGKNNSDLPRRLAAYLAVPHPSQAALSASAMQVAKESGSNHQGGPLKAAAGRQTLAATFPSRNR